MTKTITLEQADNGQRLDRWLKNKFPTVAYTMIQKSLRTGDIRVNGKKEKGDARLSGGDEIRLPPALLHALKPPEEQGLSRREKQLAKEMLIYEDDAIIVFNKPSGIATQGGSKTARHMDYYLQAFVDKNGDKPKLVHRLDKETSGVLVVAKTRAVAQRMGEIFKHRDAKKTYLAVTADVPRRHEGYIRHHLTKENDRVVVVDKDNPDGKMAMTFYKTLSFSGRDVALVALRPETGRMHQLRVHLAHIRTPILGDKKYGGDIDDTSFLYDAARERLWLHALFLHFPHPVTGKPVSFSAPVPKDMQYWMAEWNIAMEGITDTTKPEDPMDYLEENA